MRPPTKVENYNNNNNNNVYFLKQSFYKWKNERKNKKQSINWIPVLCPGGNTKYGEGGLDSTP